MTDANTNNLPSSNSVDPRQPRLICNPSINFIGRSVNMNDFPGVIRADW